MAKGPAEEKIVNLVMTLDTKGEDILKELKEKKNMLFRRNEMPSSSQYAASRMAHI